MTQLHHLNQFFVQQKIAMTVNRYKILQATPQGAPGPLIALAQQKRLALKEVITFYADEERQRPVFSFKARKKIDLNAGYDVFDEFNNPIGFFRKDFKSSLMRSTFIIEGPGYSGKGQERSPVVALLRRFSDIPFLPVHFDFVSDQGEPLISVERQVSVRDKYTVRVPDPRVDFRAAAAVAVATDALMAR